MRKICVLFIFSLVFVLLSYCLIYISEMFIPNSVWTAISRTATLFGLGMTVIVGMEAISYSRTDSLPILTRGLALGYGALAGGIAFVLVYIFNSKVQKTIKSNNSNDSNDSNGPFSASSIIEEGDSVESIMNYLYFNLYINIFILLVVALLIYLFKKDWSKLIIITIIFLVILSYIPCYLALNIYNDISVISTIYQNSVDYSVVIPYYKIDGGKVVNVILAGNIIMSLYRLVLVYILPVMYINYKVFHGDWDISFIKRIFGVHFYYYYFFGVYSYRFKPSLPWVHYTFTLLIYACLLSIMLGLYFIMDIDVLTELYVKFKK